MEKISLNKIIGDVFVENAIYGYWDMNIPCVLYKTRFFNLKPLELEPHM